MSKLKKTIQIGQVLELEINDLTSSGEGIGKVDNFTIFVDKAVPGDKVEVKINKIKPNYATGKILKIINKSNKRSNNFCPYQDKCGGCPFGNLKYEEQTKIKEKTLKDNLQRIGGFKNLNILPIINAKESNYRNKAQYKVSKSGLGFYKKGTHQIINIDNCNIQSTAINSIVKVLNELIENENISIYDETSHSGLLRGILIRSNQDKQIIITFIINGKHLKNQDKIISSLKEIPSIIGIYLNINQNKGNQVLGKDTKCLFKKDDLIETLGNKKYKISPNSFFQVNSEQAKILYDIVKQFADITSEDKILDLYCGTGSIGIYLAESNSDLTGIELNKDAIEDAIFNAELNNLKNSKFYVGKAEEVINKINLKPTCIILDPPRKGCDKKLLDYLLKLKTNRIVYVSCNSATLARDLKILSEGYKIKKVQPVDMFPNTGHLETVVQLQIKAV